MQAVLFLAALYANFESRLPAAVAADVRECVEVVRGVWAVELLYAYRVPARPTVADGLRQQALVANACRVVESQGRVWHWAYLRMGLECQVDHALSWLEPLRPGLADQQRRRAEFLKPFRFTVIPPK